MLKQHNHSLLVLVVFFDLLILICAFIVARQIAYSYIDLSLFSWEIKEIIVSIAIIISLFIALERLEFARFNSYKPAVQFIKSIVFFELFLFSIFYLIKIFNIYEFWDKFIFYYAVITFTIFSSSVFSFSIEDSSFKKSNLFCYICCNLSK